MRTLLCMVIALLISWGCTKEKMEKEGLSGKWKFDSYRYFKISRLGDVKDTIIKEEGIIEFTNDKVAENRGGTIYGDFASGNSKIPYFNASQSQEELPDYLPMQYAYMLLGANQNPKTMTFNHKYDGLALFGLGNGSTYTVYDMQITRVDDNTLNVKFTLNFRRLNGIFFTLKKQ